MRASSVEKTGEEKLRMIADGPDGADGKGRATADKRESRIGINSIFHLTFPGFLHGLHFPKLFESYSLAPIVSFVLIVVLPRPPSPARFVYFMNLKNKECTEG
jgi:hypothetical protein